jgi:hypothetical protein
MTTPFTPGDRVRLMKASPRLKTYTPGTHGTVKAYDPTDETILVKIEGKGTALWWVATDWEPLPVEGQG